MLTARRRRPGAALRLLLLLASAVAFSHAAGDVGDEERVGEAAAALARADAVTTALGVAEAGGEVVAQGNATAKDEGSLADMIDRALEKEFPDSEGEQGGGGAWI